MMEPDIGDIMVNHDKHSNNNNEKMNPTNDNPNPNKSNATLLLSYFKKMLYPILHFWLYQILLRPSIYVAVITFIGYYDHQALNGSFVYDDAGTIKTNIVVTGKVPWTDVFYRDFWGTLMTEIQSHKSFRPITTLSFLLNWKYAFYQLQQQLLRTNNITITEISAVTIHQMNMFGFHIVNVVLHCCVTALVTEATFYVFNHSHHHHQKNQSNKMSSTTAITTMAQIITGCIFGLHPVHVEAVTNITSRGELFMSLFALAAFLSYATTLYYHHCHPPPQKQHPKIQSPRSTSWSYVFGIYIFPWIAMILSMFSKEQGATTLLTLLIYDFLSHQPLSTSLYHYVVTDLYHNTFCFYYYRSRRDNRTTTNTRTETTTTTTTTTSQSHVNEMESPSPLSEQQQEDEDKVTGSNESTNIKTLLRVQPSDEPNENNNNFDDDDDDDDDDRYRREITLSFLRRAILLVLQTAIVVYWRYWLNGVTKPDFIYDQNPAGFAKERTTRLYSIPYVYCLYLYDYLYPMYLGPDWSGASIDLITSLYDPRIISVVLLWIFTAICFYLLLFGQRPPSSLSSTRTPSAKTKTSMYHDTRRILLISFLAFVFCPFLLSSNLLVVVGLMKADRVMYLPLMGLALLETLLIIRVFYRDDTVVPYLPSPNQNQSSTTKRYFSMKVTIWKLIGNVLVLSQLTFFAAMLHKRNVAWSHSLNLWTAAYNLNPRSKHTMYNCGYELSLQQRYVEAEYVLRPIGNPHVDGPSNTFIYAMVLYNLQRCDQAVELIEMALDVVEEKRRAGGPRNSASSLMRTKSNLLVAQGFCTMDQNIHYAGQIFYNAVQADPTNEYAVEQANKMVQRLEQLQFLEQQERARMKQ